MSGPDQPTDPADGTPTRAYPPAGGYAHPGFPPAPPPTNGLALAAMIVSITGLSTGCLPVGVVGIVLGHRARRQIEASGESGRGFATAGIVVGYLGVGLLVAVILFYAVLFATGSFSSS